MVAEPIPVRPQTLDLNIAALPDDMTSRDQWVCWRWETVDGRRTKVPVDPNTGKRASSTDRTTWASFATASDYLEWSSSKVDGLGYVFAADDPFTGIDLDKAADPATGELDPDAQAIVDRFDSFTERSISGTGAHIIIRGKVPPGGNRRGRVEMYDSGRFFVMSGHVLRNPNQIADRSADLARFHAETFPPAERSMGPLTDVPLTVTEDDLLERCMGNHKFRRLFDGDDGDYGDDASSADLAFCNILVRNGATRDQVDVIYRRSNRARPKWDQRRGDRTYGERTIDEAFDGTVIPFERGRGGNRQDAAMVDVGTADDLPDDVASLKLIILDLRRRVISAEQRAETAERRADTALERAREQITLRDKTAKIIANPNLGQERITAAALVTQFAKRTPDEKGRIRAPLMTVARAAGVSEETASKQIRKLEKMGVLTRSLEWIPQKVDPETGEITGGHKALFIAPAENVGDFAAAVAALKPDEPKTWGGARIQCADHPSANVIKTTVWACEECGEEIAQKVEVLAPNPQDAGIPNDELAATGTDGALLAEPDRLRGRPSVISRKSASSHNPSLITIDAPPDSLAAAWMSGGSTPPDRWTQ